MKNNINLNDQQQKKMIGCINQTLTELCVPAKIEKLNKIIVSKSGDKTTETDMYEFKSNAFNTVPSIFKNIYITGKVIPEEIETAATSYIDYNVSLNYKMEQYGFGENGLYIGKMTFRFINDFSDVFYLVNGLEIR